MPPGIPQSQLASGINVCMSLSAAVGVAPPPASGAPPAAAVPPAIPPLPAAPLLVVVVVAVLPPPPETGEEELPAVDAPLPAVAALALVPAVPDLELPDGAELPAVVFGGAADPAEVLVVVPFPVLEEDGIAGPCSVGISVVCCEGTESSQAAMPSMSTRMVN